MLFNSIVFLFIFLPIAAVIYYIVPGKAGNAVMLAASLIFYAWGEPVYVILLILSILFNYAVGRELDDEFGDPRRMKFSVGLGVAANVLILAFFKYYGFLISQIDLIVPGDIPYRELSIPLGLSFFTLQEISYLIDVYRGKAKIQKNIVNFALYAAMFPQLINGPVVRYSDMERQLTERKISARKAGQGATLFITGLAKKAVLANSLGKIYEQAASMPAGNLSALTAWIGCISFALQIYFEFSGYSDMACGLAKLFGFEFRKNFDHPYISRSITEFWRRWNISLVTWFREYVYLPLGGSRVTVSRNIFNMMTVWILTGMWHGAAWNYIVWGVYHGIVLVMEKYVWGDSLTHLPGPVRRIYFAVLSLAGWVLFFSPSLGYSLRYLTAMIGAGAGFVDSEGGFLLVTHWLLFIVSVAAVTPLGKALVEGVLEASEKIRMRTAVTAVFYIGLFLVSVAFLVTDTYNPFLFRF